MANQSTMTAPIILATKQFPSESNIILKFETAKNRKDYIPEHVKN